MVFCHPTQPWRCHWPRTEPQSQLTQVEVKCQTSFPWKIPEHCTWPLVRGNAQHEPIWSALTDSALSSLLGWSHPGSIHPQMSVLHLQVHGWLLSIPWMSESCQAGPQGLVFAGSHKAALQIYLWSGIWTHWWEICKKRTRPSGHYQLWQCQPTLLVSRRHHKDCFKWQGMSILFYLARRGWCLCSQDSWMFQWLRDSWSLTKSIGTGLFSRPTLKSTPLVTFSSTSTKFGLSTLPCTTFIPPLIHLISIGLRATHHLLWPGPQLPWERQLPPLSWFSPLLLNSCISLLPGTTHLMLQLWRYCLNTDR